MPLEKVIPFYIKDVKTQKQILKLCDQTKQILKQIKKQPKKEIIPFPKELDNQVDGSFSLGN